MINLNFNKTPRNSALSSSRFQISRVIGFVYSSCFILVICVVLFEPLLFDPSLFGVPYCFLWIFSCIFYQFLLLPHHISLNFRCLIKLSLNSYLSLLCCSSEPSKPPHLLGTNDIPNLRSYFSLALSSNPLIDLSLYSPSFTPRIIFLNSQPIHKDYIHGKKYS